MQYILLFSIFKSQFFHILNKFHSLPLPPIAILKITNPYPPAPGTL